MLHQYCDGLTIDSALAHPKNIINVRFEVQHDSFCKKPNGFLCLLLYTKILNQLVAGPRSSLDGIIVL